MKCRRRYGPRRPSLPRRYGSPFPGTTAPVKLARMTPLLPLLTAFATGFTHALAPDHVAAVSTFVSRRPSPRECVRFGARWGLGHSASLMLAGGLLISLDLTVPEGMARNLERAVGLMLFGLGVWLLWTLTHGLSHRSDPVPDARAPLADHHHDRRGSFLVGMAHGLAGTAPLIGVIPLAFIEPGGAALAYLGLFSAGTILAMALFAGAAGALLAASGRASPRAGYALRLTAAVGSTVLGAVWFLGA